MPFTAAAQTTASRSAVEPAAFHSAPTAGSATGAARGGFGYSGALRFLIAGTGVTIDPDLLRTVGVDRRRGHRWDRLDRPGPRLLGVPAAPLPSQAGNLPDDAGEVVTPAEPGIWRLESGPEPALTVATPVAASRARGGRLNGYHIGVYPTAGSDRQDAYRPPDGFVEVTPETVDVRVSEHFTLGQFLTKDQVDVWPKYVALDLRLIDKLELVLQELAAMGVRARSMHVMSGFRTPQYNGPGGDGRAALSRHMWGDAADVWVDNRGTGMMDDLNGDGRVDIDDAAVIMRAVERVERRYPELVGGAGIYPTSPTHGPYIHIDARGTRARW